MTAAKSGIRCGRLLAALALALLGAACSSGWSIDQPRLPALLGPVVDSVVVRAFEQGPGVDITAADLALFDKHLREGLNAIQRLRTFDEPPTQLANTVVLSGRVERFAVNERTGDGLVLRTIELAARLTVHPANEQAGDTELDVQRAIAWQKVYAGTVSGLALDLEDAVRELTGELTAALLPAPQEGPVALQDGRDPVTGEGRRDLGLIRGNRFATAGLFDRARLAWQRVLFDPLPGPLGRAFHLDALALNQLRAAGLSEEVLETLKPLQDDGARSLVSFRERLREALGESVPNEGLILTLADVQANRQHRSAAAAHLNLAALYRMEGRKDLVAYHWALAWAHNPDPALLERWRDLQAERKVLPANLSSQDAMRLYLRIPPPSTAQLLPGRFERTVLPPPAFPEQDGSGGNAAAQPAASPGSPSRN